MCSPVEAGLTSQRSGSMRRFVCIFASFILSVTSLAQDNSTGAVRGIVLDPAGNHLNGATVALVKNATAAHYEQTSDKLGHFAFELLPPASYSARVTADGM